MKACLSVAECSIRTRATAGRVRGPRLGRLTLKSPCFCDSLIVNKAQHIFYSYIFLFALFNLVSLASPFPLSWLPALRINLLYVPSFPSLQLPFNSFVFPFLFLSSSSYKGTCRMSAPRDPSAAPSIHGMPDFTRLFGDGARFPLKKKSLVLPVSIPKAQIIKKHTVWGKMVPNEQYTRKKTWFSRVRFPTNHELYGKKTISLWWPRYCVPRSWHHRKTFVRK